MKASPGTAKAAAPGIWGPPLSVCGVVRVVPGWCEGWCRVGQYQLLACQKSQAAHGLP
ncbi:hypothetical protein GCM10027073_22880 [Streptomyces chlorus]